MSLNVTTTKTTGPPSATQTTRYETRMELRSEQDLDKIWTKIKEDMFGCNIAPAKESAKESGQEPVQESAPEASAASAAAPQQPSAILTEDMFTVTVPVSEFKPEELSVKVLSDRLVVEAEREESKQMDGESGSTVLRHHWKKSFVLPKSVDCELLASSLSADGVLTVTAPVKCPPLEAPQLEIPIRVAST